MTQQPCYLHIDIDPEKLIDFLDKTGLSDNLFKEPLSKINLQELKDRRLFVNDNKIQEWAYFEDPYEEIYYENHSIPTYALSKEMESIERLIQSKEQTVTDEVSRTERLFLKVQNIIGPDEKLTKLEKYNLSCLAKSIINLCDIPEHRRTKAVCYGAVMTDYFNLSHVPDEHMTKELCDIGVKKYVHALSRVPGKIKTDEYMLEKIKECNLAIRYMPKERLTKEMCEEAVKRAWFEPYVVHWIPYLDVCMKLSEKMPLAEFVKYIDPAIIDEKTANELVRKDTILIKSLPDHLITQDVCKNAVFKTPESLNWIPEKNRNAELCLYATKYNESLKQFVPNKIVSGENVYSFNSRLESNWQHAKVLSFEQVQKLYQGETITVKGSQIGNAIKDQFISYDKESQKITIKPIREMEKIHEMKTVPEKRKGLRM